MKRTVGLFIIFGLLISAFLPRGDALAHQPYCEQADLTVENPWQVPDATVSYAYFANLYPATDVDYFTFDASAGQSVLLSLSIPAYEGAENFAPVMVVIGPGIEGDEPEELPDGVGELIASSDQGAMMVPLGDEPEYWFEPFGRQYYYNWENYFFEAPQAATYTVAVWHPQGDLGRYSFVVGEEEIFGGDPECMATMSNFWTPLTPGERPYPESVETDTGGEMSGEMAGDSHTHADGSAHDHSQLLEVQTDAAPFVDLQLIPLDDGTYNLRIQTLNFTFAPQKVGMDQMDGEGHVHLYIDGVKIARIYGEWYHLESLPVDAERIFVSLYANNHQALAVDGVEITDAVMISDVVASMDATTTE